MKKLFPLIILLVASMASVAQKYKLDKAVETYPNGQTKSIGYFNERGNKDGEWIYYHKNGILKQFGYYKDSLKTAEWQLYDTTGMLTHVSYYELDNRPAGWTANELINADSFNINTDKWKFKIFYSNGQLLSKGRYENGYREGKWKSYYESGKKKSIKRYSKYKLHGKSIIYFENGQREFVMKYQMDRIDGKKKSYYENGSLRSLGIHSEDKPLGEYTYFNRNKQPLTDIKPKCTDFYQTSEDGERKTEFEMGETTYVVVITEHMTDKFMNLDITDDDYEGDIFKFGKVGLYNSAINDIRITSDTLRFKLKSDGTDPYYLRKGE